MFIDYLLSFLVSMVPLIELRLGVPFAMQRGIGFFPALLICTLGNMLPVPIILLFVSAVLKWMSTCKVSLFNKVANFIYQKADKHKGKSGLEFANAVYAELGKTLNLPAELRDLQDALFDERRVGDYKVFVPKETYENTAAAKMQIPDFFGGKYILTEMESRRINQIRAYDMLAGDLLIWEEFKGDCQIAVHDGTNLLHVKDGSIVPMTQEDLDRFLIYRFFLALRPTQWV